MSDTPEIFSIAVKRNTKALGMRGEKLAREHLRKKRYNIVEHNFRCPQGEIDLIVRKDKAFRFIEVKFRRTMEYGPPEESVVRRQQQRIRKAALVWLNRRHLPMNSEIHFDVLAISEFRGDQKYEYIEDAF
jgi:putative endonuclease